MKAPIVVALLALSQVVMSIPERPAGLDLYMPVPESNWLTASKIDQGRRWFFDRRLSRDGTVSCGTCHEPERAFTDNRPIAVGMSGRAGRRNVPTLLNRGYGRLFFWDGRSSSLEALVLQPIEDPDEMGFTVAGATAAVGTTADELSRALATYVRSIYAGDAPFDRFAAGDESALNVEQRRGLDLFRHEARCVTCHIGPTFSDESLHNTGVAWDEAEKAYRDIGAGLGRFKTPTLRQVSETAPYMHDGSLTTLEDVVDFYDRGGRANQALDPVIVPLGLAAGDKRALVAFLGALSGRIAH